MAKGQMHSNKEKKKPKQDKNKKKGAEATSEIAPELTGHGLPLSKCEAYNRVYDQPSESH
jgi:hypothetical protein